MTYELRHFDTVLLKFNTEKNTFGERMYSIVSYDEEKKNLLPVGMNPDGKSLEKFLTSRVIPKNREFVNQILASAGLSSNDTMGIIEISKGLSLNDSYWITEEGFKGTFSEYNLYDHNFARILSLVAYTGYGSNTKHGFILSPEFTTNGMLKKCWRRNNGIYLYKGGTSGEANAGLEPYSEYYAAEIAETMGLHHVFYDLSKWKGELCSFCKLFTDKDTSYVPFYRFLDNPTLSSVTQFIKGLGDEFYEEFSLMFIFDAIIYNTDRHFGNFGLLVDSHTNKILSMAPIFDNGLSLFNYAMEDDLKNISEYSKTRMPSYQGVSWDNILDNFLTDEIKARVRKLIGFRFKKHKRYNLPDKRLKKLEDFIQKRIQYILGK